MDISDSNLQKKGCVITLNQIININLCLKPACFFVDLFYN